MLVQEVDLQKRIIILTRDKKEVQKIHLRILTIIYKRLWIFKSK